MGDERERMPAAGGLGALKSTFRAAGRELGISRSFLTLARLNQLEGFDCPGCAWPDPAARSAVEFCENGAKAVAHEATRKRLDRAFFERWSLAELAAQTDHWLEAQGRLTEPLYKAPAADRYAPITWDGAFERIGEVLRGLPSPNAAAFYTSGRTSNEAAFLYQLFARQFGTNNLPDCSNMCHESSGVGLGEAIGVGKGTVGLDDFERTDLILVIGQNPGSNHPRMLTALQAAKRRGARIVSINPLRERGLVSFAHPQEARGLLGVGTPITDLYLQVRVGGDVALLKGIQKQVLAAERAAPGQVLDHAFLAAHTSGFSELEASLAAVEFRELESQSGISRDEMRAVANEYVRAERVIACWAMGVTQHRNGVANIQEIMNLLLLRGNIGRAGAGPCPVRGHSNVQGDRTVGITEKPTPNFLASLGREFGFSPPTAHGLDTLATLRAMHAGRVKAFVGLGGNFATATPDSERTAQALQTCALTVQVSTKLNRSHLVTGREAFVLPCLGRTESDVQGGAAQFVSVENSMSVVHASRGKLAPASEHLRSEPWIVSRLARAVLGADNAVPWEDLSQNYDAIRDCIERVIPGFDRYNERVREAGGFVLPSGARERRFDTATGRARFIAHGLPDLELAPGQLRLTTIRSHDQFNTTVYGLDDRYRGVHGDRRVVFVNARDLQELGLRAGARVDITSHFRGETRGLSGFKLVAYDVPRGCAAAYFPEANPLVPAGDAAEGSNTPAYKSIAVSMVMRPDLE